MLVWEISEAAKEQVTTREVKHIVMMHSVTEIGNNAFYGCSSLSSLTIPESVTEIGYGAFSGCSSLLSLTIPESVTQIGDGAFYECSLSVGDTDALCAKHGQSIIDCIYASDDY